VIAIYPLQAKDFRSPEGIYRVRLCLEDPTARIHALLYAEDGVRFLLPFNTTYVLGMFIFHSQSI